MTADRTLVELTRDQILGHRRRVSALDVRLPAGSASLEAAAWAGLQDSMPRAALLSLHARVEGVTPTSWEAPALMQVWGPRFAVYVVSAREHALFTVSRFPDDARGRQVADEIATRMRSFMGDQRMRFDDVAAGAIVGPPNSMRYATTTGTVAIRWDGARQPHVWLMPRPEISVEDARREAAKRYLHVFGPSTPAAFAGWLGISLAQGRATFDELTANGELLGVSTPIGDGLILASDEASFRVRPDPTAAARLLPSGDTFTLLKAVDRELLVPDATRRALLWTPRVWPGALLVSGELAGTWRRDQHRLTISAWRRLSPTEVKAAESEALSLPLPGLAKPIAVTWQSPSA